MTNEHVLHRCQDEIDRVLPNGTELTYAHLNDLPICEAVLYETLRLYPPASLFTRYCIREHTIGKKGHRQLRIPAHATIWLNLYSLHRQADLWPQPLIFDYTRFLRHPITGLKPKLPHPYSYLPFAAGSRNCIGQHFAMIEAKVILALFIQKCNFLLQPGQKIIPDVRITMRPKYGLLATLIKRQIPSQLE